MALLQREGVIEQDEQLELVGFQQIILHLHSIHTTLHSLHLTTAHGADTTGGEELANLVETYFFFKSGWIKHGEIQLKESSIFRVQRYNIFSIPFQRNEHSSHRGFTFLFWPFPHALSPWPVRCSPSPCAGIILYKLLQNLRQPLLFCLLVIVRVVNAFHKVGVPFFPNNLPLFCIFLLFLQVVLGILLMGFKLYRGFAKEEIISPYN